VRMPSIVCDTARSPAQRHYVDCLFNRRNALETESIRRGYVAECFGILLASSSYGNSSGTFRNGGCAMNAKKIVFPTDFSTLSDSALAYATTLARDAGAKLLIVHVEEPPTAYGGGEMYYGIIEADTKALAKM